MTFGEACAAMRQGDKARPIWFANDDPLWFVVHRDYLSRYLPSFRLPPPPEWQAYELFSLRLSRFDYAQGYMSVDEFGPLTLAREDCEWELYTLPKMPE
jgi:hypothetical protein